MTAHLPDAQEGITRRQLEVARLVADGKTNPEIAERLGISLDGAKYHVSELLGRLGLERREEVAVWYRSRPTGDLPRRARALLATPLTWLAGGAAAAVAAGSVVLLFAAMNAQGGTAGDGVEVVPRSPTAADDRSTFPIALRGDPPTDGGMQAMVGGTLEVDVAAGCVWLASGDMRYTVVWPPGTGATRQPFAVHLPDGQVAHPGDVLLAGGGVLPLQHARSVADGELPEHCAEANQAVVFNHYADIDVSRPPLPGTSVQRGPLYFEYEVAAEGETVQSVAARFGVRPLTVVWNNAIYRSDPTIPVGTRVGVPAMDGALHEVAEDETIEEIAARYGVDPAAIRAYEANGLRDGNRPRAGSLILVPGARLHPPGGATLPMGVDLPLAR